MNKPMPKATCRTIGETEDRKGEGAHRRSQNFLVPSQGSRLWEACAHCPFQGWCHLWIPWGLERCGLQVDPEHEPGA